MSKILDKILLWLVYRRWRKVHRTTTDNIQYPKRRQVYEAMIWEIKTNNI